MATPTHCHKTNSLLGSYNITAMCLRATGLRFFQICHCAELNKIVEATMPVNPYDDRKVSLRRPHGNGDLDIVRASYTRRKANVTEAFKGQISPSKNYSNVSLPAKMGKIYGMHKLVGLPPFPEGLLLLARWESGTPVFEILVRALDFR